MTKDQWERKLQRELPEVVEVLADEGVKTWSLLDELCYLLAKETTPESK